MKTANLPLQKIIWNFSQNYLETYVNVFQHLPITETDDKWPSPCEKGTHQEIYSLWQPSESSNKLTFDNVETALEMTLHDDIKSYFTSMYCDTLDATCSEGDLSLLFAWNDADFSRLQENLIGHVLMKQKLKQNITIFFAVTDNDDHILSVDNETGEVWVEKVGKEPHKKLANSLADFFTQLSPKIPPTEETQ